MENRKSISIRLVYVIAFFAIIIAIIIGKNFSKDKDVERVAESSEVQLQNEENTKISSINRKNCKCDSKGRNKICFTSRC